MEHLDAPTLEQVWDKLDQDERVSVCGELKTIVDNLWQLEQNPIEPFIGKVAKAPLYDRAINVRYMSEAGPFDTVKKFHDWFTFLHRRPMPDPYSAPIESFRQDLPDDCDIKFTHGDLHPSNILISRSKPYQVLAVVDWNSQAGYLSTGRRERRSSLTVDVTDGLKKYLPMILSQYASTWDPWDCYTSAMGC
ncbi:hypothetical protein BJY00DRAFT_288790 [Aspergillus carlsbadensis]|nr:hypothetical protein BJY00DRAFT_288790 [Aspergillus carlsbadensis]